MLASVLPCLLYQGAGKMTDYVLTGLVKRRAELTGKIERTHADLRKMVDDLENLA